MAAEKKATNRAPSFKDDGFIRAHGFRIRLRTLADGRRSFQLDLGRSSGRHIRKQFSNEAEARLEAERRRAAIAQNGAAAFALDDKERAAAAAALDVLRPTGADLLSAAKFYAQHHRPVEQSISLADLRTRYLADAAAGTHRGPGKKKHKLAALSLRDIAGTTQRLIDSHGAGASAHTITTDDINAWILAQEVGAATQTRFKAILSGFFRYAVLKNFVPENRASGVDVDAADNELPDFWKPDRVAAIMRAAEALCPRVAPYLSLCFFAGLRPMYEGTGLAWDDIDLKGEQIIVPATISKRPKARPVPIEPNLKAWLEKYRPADGKGLVYPHAYRIAQRDRRIIAKAVGLTEWPVDIARHSFCTYFLALHDEARAMRAMGHTSVEMLRDHYDGMANRKQAERFFNIRPATKKRGKVIAMKGAA